MLRDILFGATATHLSNTQYSTRAYSPHFQHFFYLSHSPNAFTVTSVFQENSSTMGLYTVLPEELQEVDIIIAGGASYS